MFKIKISFFRETKRSHLLFTDLLILKFHEKFLSWWSLQNSG